MNYPTHAVYKREIFEQAGKLKKGYEGSQDYDLILRVAELTKNIERVPLVLYSWRKVIGSTAENISGKSYAIESARRSLMDALRRRGLKGEIHHNFYPFKTKIKIKNNLTVDIIIPMKDKVELLENLIISIKKRTIYPPDLVNLIILDNNSEEEKTKNYLRELESDKKLNVKIQIYNKEFNFAAVNNFGVEKSKGEYLLFLNNDTEIITKGWLTELLSWTQQKEIGAVGCKLLYKNRDVQHAGIVLGVGGVAHHAYYRLSEENDFYFNHLHCVRNYLAVTGACLMVSREKFVGAGAFNEDLPAAFNDVDLCLKLFEKGYRNVYTPHCEIFHYESRTRDPKVEGWEDEYMKRRWGNFIKNDPFYNPNLNRDLNKGRMFSVKAYE